MHHPAAPCHPAHNPCAPACDPRAYPPQGVVIAYVPVFCAPAPTACGCQSLTVPRELLADAEGPEEAFIGGESDAHLTLEYLVEDDAAAPEVKVTLSSGGMTTTWSDTGIAAGYHVKQDFVALEPGSTVVLEVTDAAARLRWCETVCC